MLIMGAGTRAPGNGKGRGGALVATLGGGCFWCVEAVYERIAGIKSVVSGYAGGTRPNPTYEEVCTGTTGHAEVVQVEFDPEAISYEKILELFWKAHDPTSLNRQGADAGTQYRSLILVRRSRRSRPSTAPRTTTRITISRTCTPGIAVGEVSIQAYIARGKASPTPGSHRYSCSFGWPQESKSTSSRCRRRQDALQFPSVSSGR